MKLIVGLGNPGQKYKYTRHNAGFLAIDKICEKYNLELSKKKFEGEFVVSDDFILAKPLTYMNNSGQFISEIANFFKINSSDIMVIHDDKDFKIGQAAIKIGGRDAGHNGIANVIQHFKTNDFKRLRIGIANDKNMKLKDFVLSKFEPEEIKTLELVLEEVAETAISFVYNDIATVINKFNINKKRSI